MSYIPRLKEKYQKEIVPKLKTQMGCKSVMEVPRITKIVINQGLGNSIKNSQILKKGLSELTIITGQKAVSTKAKKSVSNFKLRKGMQIGAKVTLRGNRMYEFLDRLLSIALPRVKDFKGIKKTSFDKIGNYNLGIKEQIIFPELSIDQVNTLMGMNISFCTTAKSVASARTLLEAFEFPFAKK